MFKSTGNLIFPAITNNGGTMTTEGNDRVYTFDVSSGTGYSKSTITCVGNSAHPTVQAATGSADIYFAVSGGQIRATCNGVSVDSPRWAVHYTVSTPPSGGSGGGSVKISPMTQYTQKAIKPAWVSGGGGGSAITKTFLIKNEE